MPETTVLFERLAVALALGLLIGVERGWKTRDLEEGRRVAGVRTFAVIGLLGGLASSTVAAINLARLSKESGESAARPLRAAGAVAAVAGVFLPVWLGLE